MKRLWRLFVTVLLCLIMVLPVSAAAATDASDGDSPVRHNPLVVDQADLLTTEEELELTAYLEEISDRQQFDVVVVTTNDIGDSTMMEYADDFYDYYDYGYGEDYDGALLLINMDIREWYISTCGYGIHALSDYTLDSIGESMVSDLGDGNYAEAFYTFADSCDQYVTDAKLYDMENGGYNDNYYDEDGYYDDAYYDHDAYYKDKVRRLLHPGKSLIICLILGLLFSCIPMRRMKNEMKSVAQKTEARDYVKKDSVKITKSRDAFLYSNVTKVRKPKEVDLSGGGHSSVHRSFSGRSHGGRGGGF